MKMVFFTNISHELRTPLSLILSPLPSLINRERDGEVVNKPAPHPAQRLPHAADGQRHSRPAAADEGQGATCDCSIPTLWPVSMDCASSSSA